MIRRLDDKGDIVTSGRHFAYDKEEIGINILTRLRLFRGENFRDIEDGTPWFQDVLLKSPEISVVSQVIKSRILETQGVAQIVEFSINQEQTRTLSIEAQILTDSGELTYIEGGDINVTI